ncbi:MAG: DUF1016 family protein [Acidaminococcaceae bacterium]|nr:DUF1016 family protein [Acidaminococcaceae bacterium]
MDINGKFTFEALAEQIKELHLFAQSRAMGAINRFMTLRNWLIGAYIVEFEQCGEERASYGDKLLSKLENRISIRGLNKTLFKNSRRFYLMYPQIGKLFVKNKDLTRPSFVKKKLTSSDFFDKAVFVNRKSPTMSDEFVTDPYALIAKLSFSHIVELTTVEDYIERFFYEFECMRCGWTVRELRRQIATNLYFRVGLSKNPAKLLTQTVSSESASILSIRDPFAFEFLGLEIKDTVSESDIEQALMDHLQEFLLEMGKGFCFEARQKRIIIDDEYFFIDLVLYNRVLHCNVIIELKDDKFTHEHFGQLNAYVAYYKENEMNPGDNPPVGILLCTKKGPKMVEYALSGMDNQLFVSTYKLQLPDKSQLKKFLLSEMEEIQK